MGLKSRRFWCLIPGLSGLIDTVFTGVKTVLIGKDLPNQPGINNQRSN